VSSGESFTDADVIDEAAIEDLLQLDGVELMPQPSSAHKTGTNTFPENDAILREVLMLATENRRLREQNEVCCPRERKHSTTRFESTLFTACVRWM
jgi:hypothetical protein